MDYKAKECVACGSDKIKLISHKNDGENIFYTYRCEACGEVFSTERSYRDKVERARKEQARRERIKKDVEVKTEAKEESNGSPILSAVEVFKANKDNVTIVVGDFYDAESKGTGVLLGGGYILSNAHVVSERDTRRGGYNFAGNMYGITLDGRKEKLKMAYVNVRSDLVLLYSEKIDGEGAAFCKGEVETGEHVFAIGNSKGQGICILDGIVSDSSREAEGEEYIMYSAPTVQGNSGGPVFNVHGEVIGIVKMGQIDAPSMNYAIPVSRIKEFLAEAKNKYRIEVDLR